MKYLPDGWAIEVKNLNGDWAGFISFTNRMSKQECIDGFVVDQNHGNTGKLRTWRDIKKDGYRCSRIYRRVV